MLPLKQSLPFSLTLFFFDENILYDVMKSLPQSSNDKHFEIILKFASQSCHAFISNFNNFHKISFTESANDVGFGPVYKLSNSVIIPKVSRNFVFFFVFSLHSQLVHKMR